MTKGSKMILTRVELISKSRRIVVDLRHGLKGMSVLGPKARARRTRELGLGVQFKGSGIVSRCQVKIGFRRTDSGRRRRTVVMGSNNGEWD